MYEEVAPTSTKSVAIWDQLLV